MVYRLPQDAFARALVERALALGARVEPRLQGQQETAGALQALSELAREGLTAFCVPQALGGADAQGWCPPTTVSVRLLCALRGALAYHHGWLDVMLVMQGLGSHPLALGDGLRHKALLGEVARGQTIAAFALTEPNAGSNVAEIATRAKRTERGWRIDGHKAFISNAGIAGFYSLIARTAGEPGESQGLSLFHLPGKVPGLRIERFEVLGPHPIGELFLEGVELPEAALVGQLGAGLELALGNLARFRTTVAAAANGFARRALDETRAHLARRMQFGKPLSAQQALRFDVAEMDVRLRAAELLVEEAAAAVDAGGPASLEVARAKLWATETAGWICDRAVQLHGGSGVRCGTVVERLYRDVRALRIYEGTSEIQKLIIARELL